MFTKLINYFKIIDNNIFPQPYFKSIRLLKPPKLLHIKELFVIYPHEILQYIFTKLMKIKHQYYTKMDQTKIKNDKLWSCKTQ